MDDGDVVSICGYAYLSGPNDRVIIDNDCGDNSSALVHEIGHYFSLLHTHSTSGLGEELVDGSNCSLAGDLLCDTPADPRLSSSNVNSSCTYTGTEIDGNGDPYSPDPENIMSYSRKRCRIEFSDDQLDQMTSYLALYRNYLNCAPVTSVRNSDSEHFGFDVYPNPSKEELTVRYLVANSGGEYDLSLFNLLGKMVLNQTVSKINTGSSSIRLNLFNQLPAGIYYLKLTQGNRTAIRKIVKL